MHRLIEELHLDGDLRWLVAQKNRVRNGELYRLIADSHGAFVQPALYEAFGLTVCCRSQLSRLAYLAACMTHVLKEMPRRQLRCLRARGRLAVWLSRRAVLASCSSQHAH